MQNAVSKLDDGVALDDFIAFAKEPKSSQDVLDLPIELAFIDVVGTLPKISTLPIGGSR